MNVPNEDAEDSSFAARIAKESSRLLTDQRKMNMSGKTSKDSLPLKENAANTESPSPAKDGTNQMKGKRCSTETRDIHRSAKFKAGVNGKKAPASKKVSSKSRSLPKKRSRNNYLTTVAPLPEYLARWLGIRMLGEPFAEYDPETGKIRRGWIYEGTKYYEAAQCLTE